VVLLFERQLPQDVSKRTGAAHSRTCASSALATLRVAPLTRGVTFCRTSRPDEEYWKH